MNIESFKYEIRYNSDQVDSHFPKSKISQLDENHAAIRIQKMIRGHLARKPFLNNYSFSNCRVLCRSNKRNMEVAPSGKTPVYLPKEMTEIILKQSGRNEAIKRFQQMQEVRALLNLQKSKHLVIPKANLCGDYLIEERLPFIDNPYHIMQLYLSQPEIFDEAIRELVRLFAVAEIGDLVSRQNIPLGNIKGVENYVRYDNLPLYIIERNGKKIGKIGLIDLEHFKNKPNSLGFATLVRIFPFHLELIKEEVKLLDVEIDNQLLDENAQKGKKYLKVGFSDHLEWLNQKKITANSCKEIFQISHERKNELASLLEKELLRINEGNNDFIIRNENTSFSSRGNFLKNPEIAGIFAEKMVTLILENITLQIKKIQKKLKEKPIEQITEGEIVKMRSPILYRQELFLLFQEIIWEKNIRRHIEIENFCGIAVTEQLLYVLMEDLVKKGDIFVFDPGYYTGGHNLCWLRY